MVHAVKRKEELIAALSADDDWNDHCEGNVLRQIFSGLGHCHPGMPLFKPRGEQLAPKSAPTAPSNTSNCVWFSLVGLTTLSEPQPERFGSPMETKRSSPSVATRSLPAQ